jgi:purine-binding chemotaxis protein CheW
MNAPNVTATSEPTQYLTFLLAKEVFALQILSVKEIIEYGALTTVPMMPSTIRGVINLRGAVLPVVDLAARFGGPPATVSKRSCIVVVEHEEQGRHQHLGLMVDAVNAVVEIPADDIAPPPSFGARIPTNFIAGMGKMGTGFVIILDPQHVLSTEDLAGLVAASTAVAPAA